MHDCSFETVFWEGRCTSGPKRSHPFFHPAPSPVTFPFLKEVIKVMITDSSLYLIILPNSLTERLQEQAYTLTPFFSIILYIIQWLLYIRWNVWGGTIIFFTCTIYVSVYSQCKQSISKFSNTSPPPPVKKKKGLSLNRTLNVFLRAPDKIIKNIFVLDCFDEQAKRVLAKVAL